MLIKNLKIYKNVNLLSLKLFDTLKFLHILKMSKQLMGQLSGHWELPP